MAGYSRTPLAGKLGIAVDARVLLDGAPDDLDLGELPDGVTVARRVGREPFDVIVCFCPNLARLAARWPVLHERTTVAGALWVAWPKKASGVATDLTDNVVRDYALTHGRVDVKICAVDETWSGMKHVIRKSERAGRTGDGGR